MTSSWFLVAMTVERMTSVLWPLHVSRYNPRTVAWVVVLGLSLWAIAMNGFLVSNHRLVNSNIGKSKWDWF